MRAFDRLCRKYPNLGLYPVIVADDVHESVVEDGAIEIKNWLEFVLVPPFENFAIESNGRVTLCTVLSRDEALSSRRLSSKEIPDNAKWVFLIKTYEGGKSEFLPPAVEAIIAVDEMGVPFHHDQQFLFEIVDAEEYAAWVDMLGLIRAQGIFVAPTYFAVFVISLMNCRNVELVDNPLNRQQRRRNEQGKGIKTHSYYTLKIKPMGKVYEPTGEGNKGNKHRLHIMRGHFKTYSDDAPLFGKFTGTYYWGASVRGNADKGTIKKDYEVVT
jgi:hypothetical protein